MELKSESNLNDKLQNDQAKIADLQMTVRHQTERIENLEAQVKANTELLYKINIVMLKVNHIISLIN